jgi:ABC-2 type transport system permease protein
MNTMKWLLKRELWENKGMLFWAPVVVGTLLILLIGGAGMAAIFNGTMHIGPDARIDQLPLEHRAELVRAMATSYMALSAPLFLMLSVVPFFYCLAALYDERRDRSILFWKSLPVSDLQTVLSKVLVVTVITPLVTFAVATLTSLFLLLFGATMLALKGVNVFGELLSHPAVYLTPLQLFALLPVYALWALPTIGWLLMVSAWARSKVFLWAVGVPLLSILAIKWSDFLLGFNINVDWFIQNIVLRVLGSLSPGAWLPMTRIDPSQITEAGFVNMAGVVKQSWMLLGGANLWIGAIAGVAMIAAAIRLRRFRDEG